MRIPVTYAKYEEEKKKVKKGKGNENEKKRTTADRLLMNLNPKPPSVPYHEL